MRIDKDKLHVESGDGTVAIYSIPSGTLLTTPTQPEAALPEIPAAIKARIDPHVCQVNGYLLPPAACD